MGTYMDDWHSQEEPEYLSAGWHAALGERSGLAFWMDQVTGELERARRDLAADPVHDLRVAIRRCRSIADVWMALDPHPAWADLKREGKKTFRKLGELRDVQVMMQWIRLFFPEPDPAAQRCIGYLEREEAHCRQLASKALDSFNVKKWRNWKRKLAGRMPQGSFDDSAFQHLALERWMEARELHRQALRNRSLNAFHRLRIGLKRFRYTVENFLPQHHQNWGRDLKVLQDALGEYHDLRVLWRTALRIRALENETVRLAWRSRIEEECSQRLAKYRSKAVGRLSIWMTWRAGLPAEAELSRAAESRLRMWATFRDPDVIRTRHIGQLALQLYDGLGGIGMLAPGTEANARSVLEAAAILQGVGRHVRGKKLHKASYREIIRMAPPFGFPKNRLKLAALAIRHHRGAFPRSDLKEFVPLPQEDRRTTILAAAILRLADAFDGGRDGRIRNLEVKKSAGAIVISAAGYAKGDPLGPKLALARHPLETICGSPVLIQPQENRSAAHQAQGS